MYDLLIDSDDPPVLKVHDTPSRGVWVEALTEEFASGIDFPSNKKINSVSRR